MTEVPNKEQEYQSLKVSGELEALETLWQQLSRPSGFGEHWKRCSKTEEENRKVHSVPVLAFKYVGSELPSAVASAYRENDALINCFMVQDRDEDLTPSEHNELMAAFASEVLERCAHDMDGRISVKMGLDD